MTALERYSVEEFSDILKVWYDFDTKVSYNYRDGYGLDIDIKSRVDAILTISTDDYDTLISWYMAAIKKLGSDYFNYLMDSQTIKGFFKLVSFMNLDPSVSWATSFDHRMLPFIHILECSFESVPLYLNSPFKEIADIALLRLKFGR